jgi:hypothetical protein
MNWVKLALATSWFLISFTNASTPLQVQIDEPRGLTPPQSIRFIPNPSETDLSDRGRPPDRNDGGGTRGNCPVEQTSTNPNMIALVPNTEVGWSATESPTFWVYVPYSFTSPVSSKLSLRDKDGRPVPIEPVEFTLSGTPGVVGLRLPKPLENERLYRWRFTIICDKKDESENPVVGGLVRWVEPNPSLMNQLQKAQPRERAALYAQNGFWYEAVTILAERHNTAPNDSQAATDWSNLLQSVQLEVIANEPIVQCCTPR